MLTDGPVDERRKLLIGAYFTQEYSLESAALFNPVDGLAPRPRRRAGGLAAVRAQPAGHGRRHISSLCFRSGIVDANCRSRRRPPDRLCHRRRKSYPTPEYDKALFLRKLSELGIADGLAELAIQPLGDTFTIGAARGQRPRRRCASIRPAAANGIRLPRRCIALAKVELRNPMRPGGRHLRADHLSLLAHRNERHRRRPLGPVHRRRRHVALLRHVHGVRRQRHLPAADRDARLPALQDHHAQRPRGPQQGHGPVPPQDQRPLRDALAAGRRKHLPDVLRHAALLVHEAAAR